MDLDVVMEDFLVVLPGNKFSRFVNAKVASEFVIMLPANQLSSNDFKNLGQVLII